MGTPVEMFDYYLPENLIAKYPYNKRDECRLMVVHKNSGHIEHSTFIELPELIDENSFLVINNTKVRNARLKAYKLTGGKSEVFVTEVLANNLFKALVKGRFKKNDILLLDEGKVTLLEKDRDGVWFVESETGIENLMLNYGMTPLPPYINRAEEESDKTNYQTIYARVLGSSAAPTAGLHFTDSLLRAFEHMGVEIVEITLDVGLGTFRPVKTKTIEEHVMHSEKYEITCEAATRINDLKKRGKKLIAVGSTSVRALEAAASEKGGVIHGCKSTDMLIVHPYKFKIVDCVITNFHLPKSTLIVMMAAFGGYVNIMNAYREAVNEGYRFYSYGDAMFITD